MATKTITGSYSSGYSLNPNYQTLDIAGSASVAGSGVTTSATQASTIDNLGSVNAASGNGISLADGGTIINGSTSNTTALIEGYHGISASKAATNVTNYGTIKSYYDFVYQYPNHATSVVLQAGGSVSNKLGATIQNGISITGGSGSITNLGTVGDPVNYYFAGFGSMGSFQYYSKTGPAASLADGGTVVNGSASVKTASMGGISISGGYGSVTNFGFIGPSTTSGGIALNAGGSVLNGTSADTSASVYSIEVSGGYGKVVNNGTTGSISLATGTIENAGLVGSGGISFSGSGSLTNTGTVQAFFDGADLGSGGTLTNGSASVTAATIQGGHNGVTVSNAEGAVYNFGSISSSNTTGAYEGVRLAAGGTIVNGSNKDVGATISGVVGIELDGTGTITNYGIIKGAGGTAVTLASANATLIEEASGTIVGNIAGGGGTLVFASGSGTSIFSNSVSGFGSIQIQSGATVALSGTTTTAVGSTFTNSGSLTNSGTLTFASQVVNSGTITNAAAGTLKFAGDVSITTDPSTKTGQISNAGTIEKTAGTGVSILRTGNGALTDNGTIQVDTGTLELTGAGIFVSGALLGAGTIEFGVGSTTLSSTSVTTGGLLLAGSGAHLTPANSLSYAGAFTQGVSTELTIGNGLSLTLTGAASFARGTIDGTGLLGTTGASTIAGATIGGTASWTNSGTVQETGTLTLNTNRTNGFTNSKGAVFDLAGNVGITATTTTRFYNLGLLAKTAGSSGTVAIALTNGGTVEVASGTLDISGAITGSGKLQIDSGKSLQLDGSVATQTVLFQGTGDHLILTDAPAFAGTLSGFGGSDKLDLTQFGTASTLTYAANSKGTGGTLTVKSGTLVANILLSGQYTAAGFAQATDGNKGDLISYTPPAKPAAAHDAFTAALFEAAFAQGGIAASVAHADPHATGAAMMAATSAVTPKV